MYKKSNLKKNYIYNLIYQMLAIILPLITTPYISRVLGASMIGTYSYTLSIVTYFSIFATLGVAVYGQLEIASHRDDSEARSNLFWEIVTARFITSIVVLIIYIVFIFFQQQYKLMYEVLILNIIGAMIDISWYFQGIEKFKLTVTRNIIIKILGTLLVFVFVKNENDLLKYALILQGTYFLGNLSLWKYLKKEIHFVKIEKMKVLKHWKNSIVYFVPTIATSVYTVLDKSMIGWITNSELQNGYYEQAHKIEQMLVTIVTSLGTVTMPRVRYLLNSNLKEEAKNVINDAMEFIIFLALPMMFGILAISKYLVPWFLGESYINAIPILQIFSILMIIVGLDNTIGKQCLMAAKRQKYFNYGVIAGAVVNVIMNIILIPRLEAIGASIASVSAEVIILIVFAFYSKDLLNIKTMIKAILKYGIFSFIMGTTSYIVASLLAKSYFQGIIIELVIAILVYVILLMISKDKMLNKILEMIHINIRRKQYLGKEKQK